MYIYIERERYKHIHIHIHIYLGELCCSFLSWMKAAVPRCLVTTDLPSHRFKNKKHIKALQLGTEPGVNGRNREVEIHQANSRHNARRTKAAPSMFAFMDPITLCEWLEYLLWRERKL